MTRPQNEGGDGLDGMWNDDFHHSAIVALTGQNVGYFSDYSGKPQEFISAAKYGFLIRGRRFRGEKCCAALRPSAFPRRRLFVSSKTTIRSRTPAQAIDRAFKLPPDAIAQSPRFFCSDRGHHCCFRARNSARPVLFYFLPTSAMQPSAMRFAEVALNCWRHFYHLPRRRHRGACLRQMIQRPFQCANSIFRSAKRIASFTICISIFSNCVAKIRGFGCKNRKVSMARYWVRRVSSSDIFRKPMTIVCCW